MADMKSNSAEFVPRFELTVKADVEAIDPVIDKIMGLVGLLNCANGKLFAIETAVRESMANAIVHGCASDPKQTVKVSVSCDESTGIIIVVRDPGKGFDPGEIPSPVEGDQIYADHGRGIYMINALMDEVRFRAGGSEIWMRKA